MKILITVIIGIVTQLFALTYFHATPAEGYLAFLLGLLVGHIAEKSI